MEGSTVADRQKQGPTSARLWAELAGLYIGVPLVVAVFLPPNWMFPVLFAMTGVGIWLLHVTAGFHWRDLGRGMGDINWGLVAGFTGVTAVICYAVINWMAPGALFRFAQTQPRLLIMIMLLYPVLSALPQEVIYRALFFRRYGALVPWVNGAIVFNAALFSLGHLMYWSVTVATMTFFGGLIFARSYAVSRNFPQTVLLHAIAGNLIFAFGLGIYFYSGNVTRPF